MFSKKIKIFYKMLDMLLLLLLCYFYYSTEDYIKNYKFAELSYKDRFTQIYKEHHWDVGSGRGSKPQNAIEYIALLQTYYNDPSYRSYVDLGCGDWQIMEHINIPSNKQYLGYDIVETVIAENRQKHTKTNVSFEVIENFDDIKPADLLIVKDVLQHWSIADVQQFINVVLPRFKAALITNCISAAAPINQDIITGRYTAIDLAQPPYNMQTLQTIMDYSKGGDFKRVYLWINPDIK